MTNVRKLELITKLVNQEAFKSEGMRNTCILSSFALRHVLTQLGWSNVKLLRVTAHIHGQDKGALLGAPPDGCFSPALPEDAWGGHLVVAVDDSFLLDPTLDQANEEGLEVQPCVLPIPPTFTDGGGSTESFTIGDCTVWYEPYYRQVGFLHQPAARPKHWKPIANAVLDICKGDEHSARSIEKPQTAPASSRKAVALRGGAR